MKRITFKLSAEVVEKIDSIAALLKVSRADVISFYLEGSTYLRKARMAKDK